MLSINRGSCDLLRDFCSARDNLLFKFDIFTKKTLFQEELHQSKRHGVAKKVLLGVHYISDIIYQADKNKYMTQLTNEIMLRLDLWSLEVFPGDAKMLPKLFH